MSDERFVQAMQALHDLGDQVAVPMKGGKTYVMVKDRIEIFRREFGDTFGISTNVDYKEGFGQGAAVVAHALIVNAEGNCIASGWAVEYVGSTKLTDASPVEVAETSAIGRALACFGLHGGEYASLNEMEAHQRKETLRSSPSQAHSGRNGPDKPVPPKQEPPKQSSQFYVPTNADEIWDDPDQTGKEIIAEVEEITTTHELGRYWAELKPTIDILKQGDAGMGIIAEIKAAFATRHNVVGGKR